MRRVCSFFLLCAGVPFILPAQTYTTLHAFNGYSDGSEPSGTLVQATDGFLYGTTYLGTHIDNNTGGTIYKISTSGAFTTLYDFCSPSGICPQNIGPDAALIQAPNGSLYGSTYGVAEKSVFAGAIFEFKGGNAQMLHSFCSTSGCLDGENPAAALVRAPDGTFYGTTEFGGANCAPIGCGTVFKINQQGSLTTLYSFCKAAGCADGEYPLGTLVEAADGDFYGTTYFGGDNNLGTVFKISPAGAFTKLASLCTGTGPCNSLPQVGLVEASNGDFYGTSLGGGTYLSGTVFKITPAGKVTTIYTFCSQANCADGGLPTAALIEGNDGNLYGCTATGGPGGQGTIYRITPDGVLTTLYGSGASTLIQATDGNFYGTVSAGVTLTNGEVFQLSAGLAPFVAALPRFGAVGATVEILGTALTGATSVAFNGTAAVFQVISSSEIRATVPAGASSGKVQVVTPSGTLSSNVSFRVLPDGGAN